MDNYDDDNDSDLPPHPTWDIRVEGRSWTWEEWEARSAALPEKMELIGGRLFWSEHERTAMLGAMLENVGLAEVVKLAPRELWLQALAQMDE